MEKALRYLLLAGAIYFVAMSLAHFFSWKLPVLFVYWDTPYFAYQDKIISFAVLTYVALFYTAFRHRVAIPGALFAITATAVGLAFVNVSAALGMTLHEGAFSSTDWEMSWRAVSPEAEAGLSRGPYWAQTAMIAAYAITLNVLYFLSPNFSSAD